MCGALYLWLQVLKLKNYFLGIEWLILASSAANFAFYWLTYSQVSWDLMVFLDAFPRAFGVTILMVLGMMAVTHKYNPPVSTDVWLFAITLVATAIMLRLDIMQPILPYFFLTAWYLTSVYLIYVTRILFSAGETVVAVHLTLMIIITSVLHTAFVFFPIPGDVHNLFFKFFLIAILVLAHILSLIPN